MSDQPVCAKCLQGMECDENEVFIDCGNGYVKSGDRFRCSRCQAGVIVGFGKMHRTPGGAGMGQDIAKKESELIRKKFRSPTEKQALTHGTL